MRRILWTCVLAVSLAGIVRAQSNVDLDLMRGKRQVQEGDLEGGIATLDGVVRKLSAATGRAKDLAQAHLFLGVAYVALDQERAGRASFREALKLDRSLRLDADRHSPRVLRAFDATLQEMGAAPAPSPDAETVPTVEPSAAPATLTPTAPTATIVVAAAGGGDFTSIREAVRSAPAGALIQVRAGMYAEALVLTKPVEIVSDAQAQIVSTGASAVVVKSDGVTLRGLTLRALAGNANDFYGVDVSQGRLTLENCDVSSEARAVLAVSGSAEAIVKHCKIHDGRAGGGLFVLDDGQATLLDSTASNNRFAGVEAKDRAVITVRGSTLRDNATAGISVKGSARATIEDCEAFGNAGAAIDVSGSGSASVRNARLHDGKGSGIVVDGGRAVIEASDIYKNALAQLEVRFKGEASVSKCKIHEGGASGLVVHDLARATVEDTELWGHQSPEVWISGASDPVLRRCTLRDSKSAGLFVDRDGRGTLEDCEIARNALAGVQATTGGNPTLRRCKIHDGRGSGLSLYERGAALVEDSEIYANGYAGVQIKTGGGTVLRRCRIKGHPYHAIWLEYGGGATVEGCDLRGNKAGAKLVDSGGVLKASGNTE